MNRTVIDRRAMDDIPRPRQEIIEQFREHDVAKISDSMAKYGSLHSAIKPLQDGMRICGVCHTLGCVPGDMHAAKQVLGLIKAGDVVVIDAWGHEKLAVADAKFCQKLRAAGAGGLIVNGAIRDKRAILESGFPVFARAVSSRRYFGEDDFEINRPINGGGLVVYPGDLIVGDDDGVVAVPHYDLARVLVLTQAKLEKELSNQAKINEGAVMTVLYGCEAKIDKWRDH